MKGEFPSETAFATFLKKTLIPSQPRTKWTAEQVVEFIKGCRESGGIPFFFTGYSGDFVVDMEPAVKASCLGGVDSPRGGIFTHVPEETFDTIKKRSGDWHFLVTRHRPDLYEGLISRPVTFAGGMWG